MACCCVQVTTTVEFARIWWDKHAKHPSMTKVSFWRPVPPPGYVRLGDCMVAGLYCPPQSVLVVRDADPSENIAGQPPLLARPLRCSQVQGYTCFWLWQLSNILLMLPLSLSMMHGCYVFRCKHLSSSLLHACTCRCGLMATRRPAATQTT